MAFPRLRPRHCLFVALVALVAGTLGLWWYGTYGIQVSPRQLLGQEHHHSVTALPWATKLLSFTAPDGTVLHGAEVSVPHAVATVLYIGGIGFTIDQYGYLVRQAFHGIPVNVVVYDPRGFGRSAGTPSLLQTGQDLLAIYHHLYASSSRPVIIHGHSLGTFLAAFLAAHTPVQNLVLEAPGTTPAAFVRFHLPWFLKWATIHVHGQALQEANIPQWLQHSRANVILLTGTKDEVLPSAFAEQIKQDLPDHHLDLIQCPGANHDNIWKFGCFQTAYDLVLAGPLFTHPNYYLGQAARGPFSFAVVSHRGLPAP